MKMETKKRDGIVLGMEGQILTGKYSKQPGTELPGWLDVSIPISKTGTYTIRITAHRNKGPCDLNAPELVGLWIKDDYIYNPSCIVTYDYATNGGSSASKTKQEVILGTQADLSVTATKPGWTHVGWNIDPNATTPLTSYTPTGDVTLYAIYKKDLTGTFIDYSGTNRTTRTQSTTIYNNQTSGVITAPNGNACTGWEWRGWSGAEVTAGNANIVTQNGGNITLTENQTFYGLYQQTIGVIYNGNGGTTPDRSNGTRYFNSAGNYADPSITITNTIPTRTGYEFLNTWNTNPNGTGTTYNRGVAYTFSSNVTVYAQWRLITHNINGSVIWNDQNNKYSSRPANVTVTLNRTPTTGVVTALPGPQQVTGNYNFSGVQTYDTTTGGRYNYTVSQNSVIRIQNHDQWIQHHK